FTQPTGLQVIINNPSINNSVTWGPSAAIIGPNDTNPDTLNPFVSNAIYVTVRDSLPHLRGVSVTATVYINKTFLDFMPFVDVRPECTDIANGAAWINIHEDDTLSYDFIWRADSDSTTLASGDSLLNVPSGNYNVHILA